MKEGLYVTAYGELVLIDDKFCYSDGTCDYSFEILNFGMYSQLELIEFICRNAEYLGKL